MAVKSKKKRPVLDDDEPTNRTKQDVDEEPSFSIPVKGGEIRATLSEYRGNVRLDVRFYYSNDGELKPSPKGTSIPEEHIAKFYKNLRKLLKGAGYLET